MREMGGSAEMSDREVYRTAINKCGIEAQVMMVFEEMSELQKELCKYSRGKNNRNEIAEEIADVEIMLEQMEEFFKCESLVEIWKHEKLKRLKMRLGIKNTHNCLSCRYRDGVNGSCRNKHSERCMNYVDEDDCCDEWKEAQE